MATFDDSPDDEFLQRLHREMPGKRVLIVDRHPAARDTLRLMLSAIGVTSVTGAANATEALRLIRGGSYDVILSDYLLDDGRSGQQLLEELRRQRLIPLGTVFIVVSSERGYHNVVAIAELAPDDYVVKPFTAEHLLMRLIKAVFRKNFLAPIHRQLDAGACTGALDACERLLAGESPFRLDVLRLKGEILNRLGRHDEAGNIYRAVLAGKPAPWARMGLAVALRGQKALDEAESLARAIVDEYPEYLSACDFLAGVCEEKGDLPGAQAVLQQAATISPNNVARQRAIGDVALRNGDLDTAERAYGKVLERQRGSSLRQVDDYADLSRVLLDKGNAAGARQIVQEMKHDWRGHRHGEYAAAVLESLCLLAAGEPVQAGNAVDTALHLHETLLAENGPEQPLPHRIAVDLAQACLAAGKETAAQAILKRVAAEHNENRHLIARIESVFARSDDEAGGRALLDQVNREIVDINNRGVLAARSGNLEESVRLLAEAADAVPNVQFLVNAAKAICALMDRQGWRQDYAERAQGYLRRATARDAQDWRVVTGNETFRRLAARHGQGSAAA